MLTRPGKTKKDVHCCECGHSIQSGDGAETGVCLLHHIDALYLMVAEGEQGAL